MKCEHCKGTGKIKKPKNESEFEQRYDRYADYLPQLDMARQRALEESGGLISIDCLHCGGTGEEPSK